jgi:hypothetical protein
MQKYYVINASDFDSVKDEVIESSADKTRKSIDGTKLIVKTPMDFVNPDGSEKTPAFLSTVTPLFSGNNMAILEYINVTNFSDWNESID